MPLYNPDLGLISEIRICFTGDDSGIRSTVLFKGCPLGCLWCPNPELIRSHPDLLISHDRCTRCGICIEVCSQAALSLGEDGYPFVDREKCDGCGQCVQACPENALEQAGRYMTVDEVVEDLLKDRACYETSGGVTFSGGEPLWQSGFVAQVARRMKVEGIHTVLDTTGDVTWCRFEEVLPFIDRMLYDIKLVENDRHRCLTGRGNDLIMANARLLAQQGIPMHIRLVMVPGINDSPADISARMDFIKELGDSVQQIEILPYTRNGVDKYDRLGLYYPLMDLQGYTDRQIRDIKVLVGGYGFKTAGAEYIGSLD